MDKYEFLVAPQETGHGRSVFRVCPGVVDSEARELFQWGYCHLLACAIHEVTGWVFGVVEGISRRTGGWTWVHMGVLTPGGDFLDIDGIHPVTAPRLAFQPDPWRIRALPDFPAFCRTVGLAADTPLAWWRGEFNEVGTRVIAEFADHALTAVPTLDTLEVAA
ncbi:hypothetical protein [Amycolatopsis sp. CA-230715]|uniref:hypothetical protein n=1 Tax=Amycolatopsis sp. CA-230715 TaxID=2745196 RepID=UPI001C02FC50|nr:hypothetical protein [Amycolatopsis sp. CA-230715]QWF80457.1 hypothetical protein HUW46_03879 [Amycolatopsis sp. CA-230715]